MKTKMFKYVVSACLVAALVIVPANIFTAKADNSNSSSGQYAQEDAVIKNKEEVIYATLAANGNVHNIYAVNHFNVTKAGHFTDYGEYTAVTNLTDTSVLTNNKDSIAFHAKEDDFYYKGDMASADLPWIFNISYYLNGAEALPQDMAGQLGEFELHITTMPNDGINTTFYENFMLQISVTLDNEKCSGIEAPDAAIASSGKNTVITYTVMPGKEADLHLTAAVNDFTMSGIEIVGMPLMVNIESPDTDDMVSDFEKLSDAISDLNDGVGELAEGVEDLKKGAYKLEDGSADIEDGLSQLSNNSGQLIEASAQINTALLQISLSLDDSLSGGLFDDLYQLPKGLSQLSTGLQNISAGLSDLKNGFSSAYAALDSAMQQIPDTAITQAQIDALYASTDPGQYDLLDGLIASYTAGQTVKGTYAGVKDAFNAVYPTIDTLSGSIDTIAGSLNEMSSEIEESLSGMDIIQQLGQLSGGLSELANNYADFHDGLSGYTNGVDDLAAGYTEFDSGLAQFANGVGDLYDGVSELYDGTSELNNETLDMPDDIQTEIDDLMGEYTGVDFKPVSFISPRNMNVSLVQFVLKCEGVEKPKDPEKMPEEQNDETIWDRFIKLF